MVQISPRISKSVEATGHKSYKDLRNKINLIVVHKIYVTDKTSTKEYVKNRTFWSWTFHSGIYSTARATLKFPISLPMNELLVQLP